jgi:hypothetical protein
LFPCHITVVCILWRVSLGSLHYGGLLVLIGVVHNRKVPRRGHVCYCIDCVVCVCACVRVIFAY